MDGGDAQIFFLPKVHFLLQTNERASWNQRAGVVLAPVMIPNCVQEELCPSHVLHTATGIGNKGLKIVYSSHDAQSWLSSLLPNFSF